MLASVEEMLRLRTTTKGLSFSVERMPDVPGFIRTDENKLRQVLINLPGKAVKFTEQGGIQLKIRKAQIIPHSQFLLLNFSVTDTSLGIAPEDLNVIFEAFCQTSHLHGSEGVGLVQNFGNTSTSFTPWEQDNSGKEESSDGRRNADAHPLLSFYNGLNNMYRFTKRCTRLNDQPQIRATPGRRYSRTERGRAQLNFYL